MLRTIAGCAIATVILGLSGMAVAMSNATAATPGHGEDHTPVNVCHATSSDTNPFVFITVDDDSVKFQGHLMHRDSPNKTWKTDGTFNGVPHVAGDAKADIIGDYTDSEGTVHTYDGEVTADTCVNHDQTTTPPTSTTTTTTEPPCEETEEGCPTTTTTPPPTTETTDVCDRTPPPTKPCDTPTTDTPSTETLIPPTSSTRPPPDNNVQRHGVAAPVPTAVDAGLSGQELPNTGAPNHLLLVGVIGGLLVASAGGLSLFLRRH